MSGRSTKEEDDGEAKPFDADPEKITKKSSPRDIADLSVDLPWDPNEPIDFSDILNAPLRGSHLESGFPKNFGVLRVEAPSIEDLEKDLPQGAIRCVAAASDLARMFALTALSVAPDGTHMTGVLLSISRDRLSAQTFNRATFSTSSITFLKGAAGLSEGATFECVVAQKSLTKAMQAAAAIVYLTFRPKEKELEFRSDNFKRTMKMQARDKFTAADEKAVGAIVPGSLTSLHRNMIQSGIAFVHPAVEEDHMPPSRGLIEARDGILAGGTQLAIAIAEAPALNKWQMRIRFDLISKLKKALDYLDGRPQQETTTSGYIIIRDTNNCFGFERAHHSFPFPVTDWWRHPDAAGTTRIRIANVFLRPIVSAAQKIGTQRIRFTCSKFAEECTIRAEIGATSQNRFEAKVNAARMVSGASVVDVLIPVDPFLQFLSAARSANTDLRLVREDKALVLSCENDDGLLLTMIIRANTPQEAAEKGKTLT